MNATFLHVMFWLMLGCTAVTLTANRYLSRRLGQATESLRKASAREIAEILSRTAPACIEERTGGLVPCFAVYREVYHEKIDLLYVYYEPLDPDDREYKRIHAEEVADKLNERP